MQMVEGGRRCGCGQHGCWEQYCSGRALLHEAREIADVQRGYGARLLELGGGRPEGIEALEVTQAAREGDPAALDCFARDRQLARPGPRRPVGRRSTRACSSSAAGCRRRRGAAARPRPARPSPSGSPARGYRPHPRIVVAELGNTAGLVGAADLARTPGHVLGATPPGRDAVPGLAG